MRDKPEHQSDQLTDEQLDLQLAQLRRESPAAPDYLAARIVSNLPPQNPLTSLTDWLTRSLWRPVLAFAIPLAFGFAIGFVQTESDSTLNTDLFADVAMEFEFDEL